ncbi:MAG: hypothetical protein P8Y30_03360 [candidate division WOR-3 bacterium]
MKPCKIGLALMGILLMLVSCSKADVSRSDTEAFLAGLSTMVGEAMMDESTMIINDFQATNPPDPGIASYIEILGEGSTEKLRDPYGLDTVYGTWRYSAGHEWELFNPGDPANAILFEWSYLDTASDPHRAEILIDSLAFYQDSMPTDLWAGIYSDDELLAWLKLEAAYLSLDEMNEVSLIYEVVNQMQVGISITSTVNIDEGPVDGTVSLWVIDRTSNDYRVDLDITVSEEYPEEIELSDSDGWRMDLLFSDVVETDTVDYTVYEKIEVTGEITKSGGHAADIDGYVWEPDDGGAHASEITITFSDDTEGDLENYLAMEDIPELP